MVIIKLKTEGQTRNRKPHHKTQSKILPLPWLAESGTEQPGQGATLLGWPKSTCIYYHNTLQTKLSPLSLRAVVPTPTALLLLSLNGFVFYMIF